jgi:pimeloyl-ACP methyl ester carboxylesterase
VTRGIAQSGDLSIAYSVRGSGEETVLLIMGLGCRGCDWGEDFPDKLAERYRVVQLDNRGTGASSSPEQTFTLEDMAEDALRVLDAVSAPRAHIVGISMGGMIAQLIALEHASRCDRLVLVSTHFGGPRVVAPTPEAMAVLMQGSDVSPEDIMRRSVKVLTAPGFADAHPEVVDAMAGFAVRQPTSRRAFAAQMMAILGSHRAERLKDVRAPTLVIHGDADPLIPVENGKAIAAEIPGARLEILAGCGHLPNWEAPDALARLVLSFLAEDRSAARP